jgi:hypothetical protein
MTEKVTKSDYILEREIQRIVSKNCESVPYEGTYIDKGSIVEAIMSLLTEQKEYSLLRHIK